VQGREIIRKRRATISRLAAVVRDIESGRLGLKRSIERHSRVIKKSLKYGLRPSSGVALTLR
jgi:hypothetical protein